MIEFKFTSEEGEATDRVALLSVEEVASVTRLNRRTIYRAVEDGELAAFKLRGRIRVSSHHLEDWVMGGAVVAPLEPSPVVRRKPRPRQGGRLGALLDGSPS